MTGARTARDEPLARFPPRHEKATADHVTQRTDMIASLGWERRGEAIDLKLEPASFG